MWATRVPAAVLLFCCHSPRALACEKQGKLSSPVAGVPPWTTPPDGQGCFTDHAQNEGVHAPYIGPRLLECGMYGCSGQWGCGGAKVGSGNSKGCPKEDCPPWPASLPKCDGGKMTPEFCSQLCLGWSESFRYAGVTNGNECWCDESLNTYGSATDWAAANRCVDHSTMCGKACAGDGKQMCGGFWMVDVYEIRADLARSAENGEMMLFWLLFAGGSGYVLLGSLYGARLKGQSLKVKSPAQAKEVLAAHPHYARWAEVRSLTMDGVFFTRAKLGLSSSSGGRKSYKAVPSVVDAVEGEDRHGSSSSSSGGKDRKRSGHGTKEGKASKSSSSSASRKDKKKSSKRSKPGGGEAEQEEQQEEVQVQQQQQEEEEKQRLLQEKREGGVHSSQQKIKVVGLNG